MPSPRVALAQKSHSNIEFPSWAFFSWTHLASHGLGSFPLLSSLAPLLAHVEKGAAEPYDAM